MCVKTLKNLFFVSLAVALSACGSSEPKTTEPTSFGQTNGSELVILLTNKGVAGDGRTDDSNAIQKVLDEAPANATVYFEDRNYLIKRPLKVRVRGLKLQGPGRILMKGGAQYAAFEVEANDSIIDSLRVQNSEDAEAGFIANGCGDAGDLATDHVIGVKAMASGVKVMRSTFEGMTYGVQLISGTDNQVIDNSFVGLKGTNAECSGGAAILVQSSFSSVQGNAISQSAEKASEAGIVVMGENAIRNDISRNEIEGNFINAIVVNNEIPVDAQSVVNPTNLVYLNTIQSNGLLIANTRNTDVFDNQIIFEQGAVQTQAAIKVWYSRDSQVLRNDVFFRNENLMMAGIWAFQAPGLKMNANDFMLHELNLAEYVLEKAVLIQSSNDVQIENTLIANKVAKIGFEVSSSPRLSMKGQNKTRDTLDLALKILNSDDAEIEKLDVYLSEMAISTESADNLSMKSLSIDEVNKGIEIMSSMNASLMNSEVQHYAEDMHLVVDMASEDSFSESGNTFTLLEMP